jgi:beta-N-acetylhexosaminidase
VEPSPTLTVAPHAPPSAAPTQPAPSTSVSTSPGAGGGTLPKTGPDAGWLLVVGLLLVVMGSGVAALLARMRRG